MRKAVVSSLRRALRYPGTMLSGLRPKGLILIYHRVISLDSDPQLLAVSPERFKQHLQIIERIAQPISLSDMLEAIQIGRTPRRAVAITFDDGYADNLLYAKPLLEMSGMPATVFVISGSVGQKQEFWWDALECLLLSPGTLPECLELIIEGVVHTWHLDDATTYSESDCRRNRSWNVLEDTDPTPRHTLYRQLCPLVRPLAIAERKRLVEQVVDWAGAPSPVWRETHRPLTPDEVRALAEGELVEVGAHTVNHPLLAGLSPEAQGEEILVSKQALEQMTGKVVDLFSYPYGTRYDYDASSITAARAAGFSGACANFPGRVVRGVDRFQLPRFLVRNWDSDMFESNLKRWLAG